MEHRNETFGLGGGHFSAEWWSHSLSLVNQLGLNEIMERIEREREREALSHFREGEEEQGEGEGAISGFRASVEI